MPEPVRAGAAGRRALLRLAAVLLLAAAGLVLSLAVPLPQWRSGRPDVAPLPLEPQVPAAPRAAAGGPRRVWIDTVAACGLGARADPDDCFALVALASSPALRIVGVSSVFGNAPLSETDALARALVQRLRDDGHDVPAVQRGAAAPLAEAHGEASDAVRALRGALASGPLTIVALGPLTNVAAALRGRPDLHARVERVIAVMGRRRGHLFHPVEGGTAPSWLGHGPVFRDLNVALDPRAATVLLEAGVPLTLVPYDAARAAEIGEPQLRAMHARGGAAAWVAARAGGWLAHWRERIGRDGFHPFDLMAAVALLRPELLRCAEADVAVARDAGVFGWFGASGLFVVAPAEAPFAALARGRATWCGEASDDTQRALDALWRQPPAGDGGPAGRSSASTRP